MDCAFRENYGFLSFGAAISALDGARPTFRRCTFESNSIVGGFQPAGGAAYLDFDTATRFEGCSFFRNSCQHASFDGSGYEAIGGAIFSFGAGTVIDGCAFGSNQSGAGGSIYTFRAIVVRSSTFVRDSVHSWGFGFSVGGYGGSIASNSYGAADGARLFESCTFVGSTATDAGGGIWSPGDPPVQLNTVRNCVFRSCTDSDGLINKAQCRGVRPRYSDVHALLVAAPDDDPIDPADYPGCFDADPQFLDVDGANGILGGSRSSCSWAFLGPRSCSRPGGSPPSRGRRGSSRSGLPRPRTSAC